MAAKQLGKRSTEVEYILREKLVCGYCGKSMQGDYGRSHTGKLFYYYVCMPGKNNPNHGLAAYF